MSKTNTNKEDRGSLINNHLETIQDTDIKEILENYLDKLEANQGNSEELPKLNKYLKDTAEVVSRDIMPILFVISLYFTINELLLENKFVGNQDKLSKKLLKVINRLLQETSPAQLAELILKNNSSKISLNYYNYLLLNQSIGLDINASLEELNVIGDKMDKDIIMSLIHSVVDTSKSP